MRYDKDVYFISRIDSYDASTGDYNENQVKATHCKATVMDTTAEIQRLLYDGPKRGAITITLQRHYDEPFEHIGYGGKLYKVDRSRRLRVKHSFFCSEA